MMSSSQIKKKDAGVLLAKFRERNKKDQFDNQREKKLLQSIEDLEKTFLSIKGGDPYRKKDYSNFKENLIIQEVPARREREPSIEKCMSSLGTMMKKSKQNGKKKISNGKKQKTKNLPSNEILSLNGVTKRPIQKKSSKKLPLHSPIIMSSKFNDLVNFHSKRLSEQRKSFLVNKRTSQ